MTYQVWISLLVRLTLGLAFLAMGINKLTSYSTTVSMIADGFKTSWLPMFLVYPFCYVLPVWETLTGVSLLLGFRYRLTLGVTGILLALLTFGVTVKSMGDVVPHNLIFVLVVLVGLHFSDHNRFAIGKGTGAPGN